MGPDDWTRVFVGNIEVTRDEYDDFKKSKPPAFYIAGDEDDEVLFRRPQLDGEKAEEVTSPNLRMNYRIPIQISSKPTL